MTFEEYLKKRKTIENENKNLVGNILNESEKRVDARLTEMKKSLYQNDREIKLYSMNTMGNPKLYESDLYRLLQRMPKGADLHVHATALVPAHKLISFVLSHPDLLVDTETFYIRHKDEENINKDKCFPLKELFDNGVLTKEELEKRWTMLGKKHSESVWDYFENLLNVFEQLEYDREILFEYYVFAFEDYLKNNVQHLEIHAVLSDDRNKAFELANTIKKAYFEVKKSHNELSVSIICAGLKYIGVDKQEIITYLKNALWLRENVIDDFDGENPHPFIIGFDLVNEEDNSLPLKEIAPILLDCRNSYPDFNLFIHCGESLVAQSDNLIDAYLLGAKRVGHGMNLYRYPKLLKRYAENEICLECCLISNQTLKYIKDLRSHPGAEYLKRGITISLCSDDPVCQEHEQLADDFFAATVLWDLNLSDVKQLCINSLMYSGVDKKQKSQLLKDFKTAWKKFIEEYE